jgi:hypothetical protein
MSVKSRASLALSAIAIVMVASACGASSDKASPVGAAAAPHSTTTLDPIDVTAAMHYVQLADTVNPLVAQLNASSVPITASSVTAAVAALAQFNAQVPQLKVSDPLHSQIVVLVRANTTLMADLTVLGSATSVPTSLKAKIATDVAHRQTAAAKVVATLHLPSSK